MGLDGVRDKGETTEGGSEMMVLIYSPAELRKRVGTVIPSGVDRFVGAVRLELPEEQKVPLATNCLEALEAPMDEGFV